MKSMAFFNNKGGVGKTTLACNMAAYIANELNFRVLVVDLDPQCNATQLLLHEHEWEKIYGNRRDSSRRTVLRVLRNIRLGDSGIDTNLDIVGSQRFNVDVLPGHPAMSMIEDRLSSSWTDFLAGDPGGARRTMWASRLTEAADYDLIVFDVGPSLGALNRTVLLGSDTFVTPMAADLFSLYALDNISEWIGAWLRDYSRAFKAFADSDIDSGIVNMQESPNVASGWLGYTVQQYVTKTMRGAKRAVNAYERYRRQIPDRVQALSELRYTDDSDLDLGVVPNMFSMVPLAQSVHAPISDLTQADGVRGAQVSQQQRYQEQLAEIGNRLIENVGFS